VKVCMILEGCYPYVHGGVSSWTHHYIEAMPDVEFTLWCIGPREEMKGQFKFKLPENVTEVREVFLDSALEMRLDRKQLEHLKLERAERQAVERLFSGQQTDWDLLFDLFQNRHFDSERGKDDHLNPVSLLMSDDFLSMLLEQCREHAPYISFANYFFNVRSMLLPVLYLMGQDIPKADLYHCTATGYGGILGSMGKWKYGSPMVLTEHGIYTREREEELLGATWVLPYLRQQWIDMFYLFSGCAYQHADVVTSLFRGASRIQADIGCPQEKQRVISNGINFDRFKDIPPKEENGYIDIGAVVRIARIKDIKTMIYAFAEVKAEVPNARLYILGDVDDQEYSDECHELVNQLGLTDIIFTGVVNVLEYLPKFDFTILTSISEGQPLSVLESFAAGRAAVTTDVGCCRELIEGEDEFGPAGMCVPPMHKDLLAEAMIRMCRRPDVCRKMGENGRNRAGHYFTQKMSMDQYKEVYQEVCDAWQESDSN